MTGVSTAVAAGQIRKGANGQFHLSNAGPGLLAIVSEYCGHCKTLKGNVQEAQKTGHMNFYHLSGDGQDNETKRVMKELKVTGFPEMYEVGADGTLRPFTGARNPETLLAVFGVQKGGTATNGRNLSPFVHTVIIIIMTLFLLAVFCPQKSALRS